MCAWENSLLQLATNIPEEHHTDSHTDYDNVFLQRAYVHCEALTAEYSKSFHLAARLLPHQKREAIHALYALCRTVDDIADLNPDPNEALHDLEAWRERSCGQQGPADDLLLAAWTDTRTRHRIPTIYVQQLLDTLIQDLHKKRYQTFDELAVYCYGVASTVGLMSMNIIGYQGDDAIRYAVKLGVALQMTNILRDIYEDWQRGRVYLPKEELHAFGLDEDAIASAVVTPQWQEFMQFQIARTREIYDAAIPGIRRLHRTGRLAVSAAATFYSGILTDIEKHDYDVFSRRAQLSKSEKLRRLPALWLRYSLA